MKSISGHTVPKTQVSVLEGKKGWWVQGRHCRTKERLHFGHLLSWNLVETGFCCGHRDEACFRAPGRGHMLLETFPGKDTPLKGTNMFIGVKASEGAK